MKLDQVRAAEAIRAAGAIAERIGGIEKVAPAFWKGSEGATISYPALGHASLAAFEQNSYWFNHRNAIISATVSRFPPEGVIFDVGGGNGYVSKGLSDAGFQTIVIEPGAAGARCASERGLPVIQAPFEELDVPAGAIGAAGMFDVLEHIPDDASAVARLHELMRPGAMLYLTVPSYSWLWSSEDRYAGHFRRYTVGSLTKLMTTNGFAVRYASYFFSMLVPAIFAARVIPTRLRLKNADKPSSMDDDHALPKWPVGPLLNRAMRWEQRRIDAGETIPFGSSCILVARRGD